MSTNTTNRAYVIQSVGENPGTWGDPQLNNNFQKIDTNLGGVATISLSSSNVTLSASEYANGTIRLTGTLTGNVQVIFPAVQGWWTIDNQTTGLFAAIINITGSPGQRIGIEQGGAADILLDGTNVKFRNLPPVGSYIDLVDAAVPAWISACTVPPYLTCDGSTFSAVTYPYLNTKLGGTTLPDLRGRARFYLDGGTGRITTAGSGIDGATRLSAGGAQTVTLVTANLPAYTPSGTNSTPAINVNARGQTDAAGGIVYAVAPPSNTIPAQTTIASLAGPPVFTGTAQGGVSTPVNKMPPAQISGITLIRAA